MKKIDMEEFTYIFPAKIDSKDRKDNMALIFEYIENAFKSNFIIAEQDTSEIPDSIESHKFDYLHVKTGKAPEELFFHKTKLINELVKKVKTPYVILNDVDIIFPIKQYVESANWIKSDPNLVIFPYTNPIITVKIESKNKLDLIYERKLNSGIKIEKKHHIPLGGCVFFSKEAFVEIGGANEKFKNYGPEDTELIYRFEKLGHEIKRLDAPLYHLDHPINNIYRYRFIKQNNEEYRRIERMTVEELREEVNAWGHV